MDNKILQKEINFFQSNLKELLSKAKGEYALIKDEKLIDIFKSKEDAIKRGYELFGNSPFLVKQIVETEEIINFTSNLISC
ncbi:MAG TPA: hypothetical protein PLF61_05550 [Candidatus Goldiibacteriota bacterium]|nr:hypothetical protein [Candidatus Goldiibacteriota bacterium]